MCPKKNDNKVNKDLIIEFTDMFQNIPIDGYIHDYYEDYKIIGKLLKNYLNFLVKKNNNENYTFTEEDIKVLKDIFDYYKENGLLLKKDSKILGFLTWAIKNPNVSKQSFYTIKLSKKEVNSDDKKIIKPREREYYEALFEQINSNI